MPNHVHLIAVPAAFDSLHRGIAEARWPCTYRWSSASAHLAGHDDLLARVQPLLDLMPNWCDFLDNAPDSAETKAIQAHARSGRPLGDDAVLDRTEPAPGVSGTMIEPTAGAYYTIGVNYVAASGPPKEGVDIQFVGIHGGPGAYWPDFGQGNPVTVNVTGGVLLVFNASPGDEEEPTGPIVPSGGATEDAAGEGAPPGPVIEPPMLSPDNMDEFVGWCEAGTAQMLSEGH